MKVLFTIISAVLSLALAAGSAAIVYFASGVVYLIIYIALCLVMFPLSGYLHELGHVIAGGVSGMKVSIIKTNMFSSAACSVSPKRGGNIRRRFIITALGGLAINLLFVIFGVIALCVPAINGVFSFTAPSSLYFLLLNIFPAEYAGGKTDMLTVAEAAKNEPTAQVLMAVLEIQGEVAAGKPLAEVEEDRILNLPQLPEDDYNFAMLTSLRYQYYFEKGDRKTADVYYKRLRGLGYTDKDFK
ncbi:MAG: hypothetical protein LUD27_08985 [Clostridia bacterium]|nr:hypothetical protein [Clostridia bacterium]